MERSVGKDPKFSHIVIPPFGNHAGIPKGAGKQKDKTFAIEKYSDSNLETSWRPTPQRRELHKCHSKNGIKSLGSKTGILIIQVKPLCLSTPFQTKGSL